MLKFTNFLLKKTKKIFIGYLPINLYIKYGLISKELNGYSIESAFIPPVYKNYSYSSELEEFIKASKPLLFTNSSKIAFWDNIDLYGLDMSIELLVRLKTNYPKTGLIIAISSLNNKKYLKKLIDNVPYKYRKSIFLLSNYSGETWPLIKKSDLFLRPTNVDAYSVSIEEAIYFKKPVLASNVVIRPKESFLFKSRNSLDFFNNASKIIKNLRLY